MKRWDVPLRLGAVVLAEALALAFEAVVEGLEELPHAARIRLASTSASSVAIAGLDLMQLG